MSITRGRLISPSIATVHGRGRSVQAFCAGSDLPVPNS